MRSSSPIGCIRLPEMSLNRSIQGEVGLQYQAFEIRHNSPKSERRVRSRSETSKFGRNQNQTVASENRTQLSEDRWKRSKSDGDGRNRTQASEVGRKRKKSKESSKSILLSFISIQDFEVLTI